MHQSVSSFLSLLDCLVPSYFPPLLSSSTLGPRDSAIQMHIGSATFKISEYTDQNCMRKKLPHLKCRVQHLKLKPTVPSRCVQSLVKQKKPSPLPRSFNKPSPQQSPGARNLSLDMFSSVRCTKYLSNSPLDTSQNKGFAFLVQLQQGSVGT